MSDWFQVGKVKNTWSQSCFIQKIVLRLQLGSYWAKFASCPWSRAFTSAFSFKRLRASESSFVSWSICSFSFYFSASWRSIKALKRSFAVRNVLRKAPAWRVMSDSLDAIWLIRYSMIKKPCVDFAAETYNREKLALKFMASINDRRCQTNLNSTRWRYVFRQHQLLSSQLQFFFKNPMFFPLVFHHQTKEFCLFRATQLPCVPNQAKTYRNLFSASTTVSFPWMNSDELS